MVSERQTLEERSGQDVGDMTTSPATSVLVNGNTVHLRPGTSLRMRICVATVLVGSVDVVTIDFASGARFALLLRANVHVDKCESERNMTSANSRGNKNQI